MSYFRYLILFTSISFSTFSKATAIGDWLYSKYESTFVLTDQIKLKTKDFTTNKYLCEQYGGIFLYDKHTLVKGGTLLSGRCYCEISNTYISTKTEAKKCQKNTIENYTNIMANLNNTPTSQCGAKVFLEENNSKFKCPVHLIKRLDIANESYVGGLGLEASNKYCGVITKKDTNIDNSKVIIDSFKLEERFQKQFKIDAPRGLINRCLEEFSNFSKDEKNNFIGKYYISQEKLKNALLNTMRELAENNLLLRNNKGFRSLQENCKNMLLPELNNACETVIGCNGTIANQFSDKVEELNRILPTYLKIKNKLNSILNYIKQRERAGCNEKVFKHHNCKKMAEKLAYLKSVAIPLAGLKSSYEEHYPWFRSTDFLNGVKPKEYLAHNKKANGKNRNKMSDSTLTIHQSNESSKYGLVMNGLDKQAHANHEYLTKKFNTYKNALKCLNSPHDSGDCSNLNNVITSLGNYDYLQKSKHNFEDSKFGLAVSKSQCIDNLEQIQKGGTKVVGAFAVDMLALGVGYGSGKVVTALTKKTAENSRTFMQTIKSIIKSDPDVRTEVLTDGVVMGNLAAKILSRTDSFKSAYVHPETLSEKFDECQNKVVNGANEEILKYDQFCPSKISNKMRLKVKSYKECMVDTITLNVTNSIARHNDRVDISFDLAKILETIVN